MISVDIDARRAQELLARLRRGSLDWRSEMEEIGGAIGAMVDLGFRAEEEPFGKKWAPLSQVTLDGRRGEGAQILRDTGVLASSFLVQELSKRVVLFGSKDIRAGTHQYGAKKGQYGRTRRGAPIPWGDIPARPMMPDVDRNEFKSEISSIIEKAINRMTTG